MRTAASHRTAPKDVDRTLADACFVRFVRSDFPDAYAGTNTMLRDTINNLVEKEPQSWHTGVGLPFRRIEGTVVEWDECV